MKGGSSLSRARSAASARASPRADCSTISFGRIARPVRSKTSAIAVSTGRSRLAHVSFMEPLTQTQ